MILEDVTKTFIVVPATGVELSVDESMEDISMNSKNSRLIESLIQTPFFNDCAYFTSIIFDTELSEKFKKDYARSYRKCNDLNKIYQKKGHITAPVNQITKEVLHKNVK